MIYLLDTKLTEDSHSKYIIDILCRHTMVPIEHIEIPADPTFGELYKIVIRLFDTINSNDIILCPWAVSADEQLDELFNDLADCCWVVASAGNFNEDIEKYSPARAKNVITVACLNKSGLKAALSNWSDNKELVWLAGTNYNVGWKNSSGTSISAAVYSPFLAESIKNKDPDLLEDLVNKYTKQVWEEINTT